MTVEVALIVPDAPFLLEPRSFPHLGVLYLSAALKQAGYKARVYDLTGGYKLPKVREEIVGITATSPQFKSALEIRDEIREYNPDALFVLGGPHATVAPETCVGFDVVVAGEGDEAIVDIARRYEKEGRFKAVLKPEPIRDLDKLPYPDRDAVDLSSYKYYLLGDRCTNIQSQRGCPFGCAFCCGRTIKTYRWARYRSPENIEGEVDQIISRYRIKALMFYDDEFNLNKKHALEVCKMLKRKGVLWRCFIRTDLFDEELAKAMAEAGCVEVGAGVETGSPKIKKIINKGTTVEQDYKAVELCRKYGIKFKAFLIVGLPGEDYETFNETRRWLATAKPDNFDATIFMPYPGSEIWEHPERYDIFFDKEEIVRSGFVGTYYKGASGGPERSFVSTSKLSAEEIARLRYQLDVEFGRMAVTPWSGTDVISYRR